MSARTKRSPVSVTAQVTIVDDGTGDDNTVGDDGTTCNKGQ